MYLSGVKPESGSLLSTRGSWNELALPLSILTELKALSQRLATESERFPNTRYGPNPWDACQFLFCGPSGGGKLLAAQLIARELGVVLWRIPSIGLVGRYIGETEKNLASVLERATGTGWVLYFDEADALFGRRSGVDVHNSRYTNQTVSYLLQRAEEYRGVVILSTNARPYPGGNVMSRIDAVVDFP